MKIEFNRNKSIKNKADSSRGFGLEHAAMMNFETAITFEDIRQNYGEPRYITYGMIEERLFALVWTPRRKKLRVISLRKANMRERKFYEENRK